MWKKDEGTPPSPPATPTPPEAPRTPGRVGGAGGPSSPATIGPSISIKGEVTGDEDLLIQGRVDGSVDLKEHAVTVGPEGKVKADITGRVVVVEGSVEGDLQATEQVILRKAASVTGDITSPRVILEDGARFRGGVDMGDPADRGSSSRGGGATSNSRSDASGKSGGAAGAPTAPADGSGSGSGDRGAGGSKGTAPTSKDAATPAGARR